MRDGKKGNLVMTFVLWMVFGCVGMALMLYAASRKTIVIADVLQEQPEEATELAGRPDGKQLLLQNDDEEVHSISIPLAKGTKAESVVMENRYMEQELWIYLQDADVDFYTENKICGDIAPVLGGFCEEKPDGVVLKLQMSEVLEYRSTMENNALQIAFCEPKELYHMIVVVDPVGGGSDCGKFVDDFSEKTVTLEVAKCLQKKLEQDGIRLYFTRLEDEFVTNEDRCRLVESVDANLYIGIGVSVDAKDVNKYGIQSYYNEAYFIPEFGNVETADILTRNVTIAAGNRANGLFPAEEESILQEIHIPAAQVSLGYLTNPQENALLRQEEYQEKLAEGLAEAIMEVYTPYVEQKK